MRAIVGLALAACVGTQHAAAAAALKDWTFGPCMRSTEENPVLGPRSESSFHCPLQGREVKWEAKDVFNPAAVVVDEKVHLLYRAEDFDGRFAGTSRVGMAVSTDGVHFADSDRGSRPVLFPDEDAVKGLEWEGGIEDPRVVLSDDGTFVMTYTAYDGHLARLCVATSRDLRTWQKHGSAFKSFEGGRFVDTWTKSGSIVCRLVGERIVAARIKGLYWLYFGEDSAHAATSSDLINWSPVIDEHLTTYRGQPLKGGKGPKIIFSTRSGNFDSGLVEPGPPAMLTEQGIVFIYNSKNLDGSFAPVRTYSAGQVLLDAEDPTRVLDRTGEPFFKPEMPYESTGQVANVVFLEGLVFFRGQWLLYYGTADSKIAVAKCKFPQLTDMQPPKPAPDTQPAELLQTGLRRGATAPQFAAPEATSTSMVLPAVLLAVGVLTAVLVRCSRCWLVPDKGN